MTEARQRIRLMTDRQILAEKFAGVSLATGHRRIFNQLGFPRPLPGFGKNLRPEHLVDAYIEKLAEEAGAGEAA